MHRPDRRSVLMVGGLAALLAVAVPALAADPPPGANPPGQENGQGANPPGQEKREAAGKPAKADKGPEIAATLRGTVEQGTDEKGRPTFTLTVDGTTWELSAGPKWYWGDQNPLAAFAGASVEVSGTHHEGEAELDVETVDGQPLRAEGKPPWAGGPKVVGEAHPGWKAWKAAGEGNGLGREGAPGQQKDKPAGGDEDAGG